MSDDVVPLGEHLLAIIRANDERYDARFRAQEKAIDKAEESVERRLEGQNEWRQQSAQRERDFLPRIEYVGSHQVLADSIAAAAARLDKLEGTRTGASQTFAWVAAAFGTLVAIGAVIVAIVR